MQILKNIFNSKEKYYLELDESLESQPAKAVAKTVEKVNSAVKEAAEEVVESKPVQKAVEVAAETKKAAPEKPETVTKTEAKTTKTDKPQKEAKPSPKNAGASSFDPPFWVAAMYGSKNASTNNNGTPAEQTFATDNLMPTISKYRRSPGPSLNKFKDMAKKAKTAKG